MYGPRGEAGRKDAIWNFFLAMCVWPRRDLFLSYSAASVQLNWWVLIFCLGCGGVDVE